jgi:hypothetical protein
VVDIRGSRRGRPVPPIYRPNLPAGAPHLTIHPIPVLMQLLRLCGELQQSSTSGVGKQHSAGDP